MQDATAMEEKTEPHTHTCTQQSFGKVSHSLPVLHVVVVVIFAAATAAATAAAASVVEW